MINDLTTSSASNFDEAMELVNFGTRMRSIASTSMNHRSSRAHTVFTFRFEQTSKDGETQMAQVQLVDLAGREQEKSSVDNKDRLKERQFINTSLFHLTTCIINLSKASKGRKMNLTDFAFRRSRLTLLLAHSLSGNSRTGMVAAVSPASSDLDETISTLRFADMVKQIRHLVSGNPELASSFVALVGLQVPKTEFSLITNVRSSELMLSLCCTLKLPLDQWPSFEAHGITQLATDRMGSAGSALQKQALEATPEEIKALTANLSEAERQKVCAALAAVEAKAELTQEKKEDTAPAAEPAAIEAAPAPEAAPATEPAAVEAAPAPEAAPAAAMEAAPAPQPAAEEKKEEAAPAAEPAKEAAPAPEAAAAEPAAVEAAPAPEAAPAAAMEAAPAPQPAAEEKKEEAAPAAEPAKEAAPAPEAAPAAEPAAMEAAPAPQPAAEEKKEEAPPGWEEMKAKLE
ncbi:unnamed protein product, partial [Effrenium voratum]